MLRLSAAIGTAGVAGVFLLQVAVRGHLEAPAATPILYDRHGAFLTQIGHETTAPDGKRLIAYGYWTVARPPERIIRATLALEDRRFWQHPGVDPVAVARAFWQDVASGTRRSGASTIAMQIARMQHPAPRTLWAKAVEAATALVLTARYGRDALIAHYLRLAPYGNGSHGIAHAARWYFDKPAADLSWAEVALLAAIPQAPGAMNPLKPAGRARAIQRGRRVLEALARRQVIGGTEYAEATAELAELRLPPPPRRPDAVHAILRISGMLKVAEPPAFDPGDPQVRTTLDLAMQAEASRLARRHLRAWQGAGSQQIAVLVLKRQSREILAAVGSAGYGLEPGGAIDFTRVSRSPGSTLKPFIYALALHSGRLTPADVMEDQPEGAAGISNADRNFLGPLLPRQALANSRNVPAANLLRKVGLDSGLEFFRDLGLHRLDAPAASFGLSMAIGSLPTSLDRLLRAYGALADEGMLRDLVWYDGQKTAPGRRVLPADVARQVTLFLSDPMARLPSFPRYGTTEFPFAVALKTGTSQGYRDAWTVAWSRDYLIGVWLGRPNAGTMREVSGARAAAGLARALALRLHGTQLGDLGDTGFAPPADHVPVELCVFTGQHNAKGCSETLVEWLPAKTAGGSMAQPAQPVAGALSLAAEPVRLSIAAPEQDVHLWRNPEAPAAFDRLALRAVAEPHVAQIVWYVDGEPFAVADPRETVYWPMLPGHHRFQIRRPFGEAASKPVQIAVE
ncbi:MAG TPA: transglycosylase domain-containing protein [Stellaceae bacterium]|nr:transglycosylase domain-containing protein [Stellaceae bacterium]